MSVAKVVVRVALVVTFIICTDTTRLRHGLQSASSTFSGTRGNIEWIGAYVNTQNVERLTTRKRRSSLAGHHAHFLATSGLLLVLLGIPGWNLRNIQLPRTAVPSTSGIPLQAYRFQARGIPPLPSTLLRMLVPRTDEN